MTFDQSSEAFNILIILVFTTKQLQWFRQLQDWIPQCPKWIPTGKKGKRPTSKKSIEEFNGILTRRELKYGDWEDKTEWGKQIKKLRTRRCVHT